MTNLNALNEKQREAVVSEEKRLLVLAGAGSGKTKTLLQKIIYLIEEKSKDEDEFARYIAPETAYEVFYKQLLQLCEEDANYLLALKRYVLDYIVDKIHLYDPALTIQFREAFKGHLDHVKEFIRTAMRITDMMKVERLDADQVLARAQKDQHERVRHFYELAIPLVRAYEQYCINRSYLDFNDLISRTVSLLQNHEDVAPTGIVRFAENNSIEDYFKESDS